jgi:hypothetical protein
MVFPGDIPGTVKVGVDLPSACLAPKEGLRRAVAPMDMSTLAATLAGVPGVDGLHDRADILLDAQAACVVTHHATSPVRRRNLFAFVLLRIRKCRAQCFGRLHAGRNHQPGRQVRMRLAQVGVCRLMERNSVLLAPFPAQRSDSVKASTRRRQCRRQDRVLVGRQLKSNAHCALHTSCMEEISAMYKGLARQFQPPRFSPTEQALWLEYPREGFR